MILMPPAWSALPTATQQTLTRLLTRLLVAHSDRASQQDMGGVALAATLRRQLPGLPLVLASGYSHVLAQEVDHGFELLHKPYSADQLARVLQRVMTKALSSQACTAPR